MTNVDPLYFVEHKSSLLYLFNRKTWDDVNARGCQSLNMPYYTCFYVPQKDYCHTGLEQNYDILFGKLSIYFLI